MWHLAVEKSSAAQEMLPTHGLPKRFMKRDVHGSPLLLIVELVFDFLMGGLPYQIRNFGKFIAFRFLVGRVLIDSPLIFNRPHFSMEKDWSIPASRREQMRTIDVISIFKERKRQHDEACAEAELHHFLSLTGALNVLGHGILSPASFAPATFRNQIGSSKASDLIDGNKVLAKVMLLTAMLAFPSPTSL